MASWEYNYRGRRVKGGFEYQYKLNTVSVDNVNSTSPFDYGVMPRSLTIIKRPLKEEIDEEYSSPMKIASVMQEKQKIEQQSYESFVHDKKLHARLGIKPQDHLGWFYSDFLEAENQASEKLMIKELNARFNEQVQKQKNAAAQEQVKEITGSVPIRELLEDEDKLLHLSMTEDSSNSYREIGENGSTITHTEFIPYPCNNPRCGICANASQIKESQQQKVASSATASRFQAGSSREIDDISDYLFH